MKLSDKKEEAKSVKFIYNTPDDYKIVYANGVFGGLTPRGDVNCSFFLEYPQVPKEQEFELDKENKVGNLISVAGNVALVNRDLQIGIILKLEDAEIIANWLLTIVKAARGEKK